MTTCAKNSDDPASAVFAVALETKYIVQAFTAAGRGLRADTPIVCRSAELARLKAERLAGVRVGVVAFSVTADTDMGEYDETPTVIFKSGRMAPAFDDQ